jgi:hypothetical protein
MAVVTPATPPCALASLDAWVHHDWSEGLQVDRLAELEAIAVRTRNTLYRLLVIAPGDGEVFIHGGHFFPDPTPARLLGCSLGGTFLKQRGIYVGFRMEIQVGPDTIITSEVRSVAVISSGRAH